MLCNHLLILTICPDQGNFTRFLPEFSQIYSSLPDLLIFLHYQFQALNMLNMSMARGMGLPHLPHPHGGHPLAGHPGVNGAPHLPTHHALTSSAGAVIGRPTSTPSTGSTNNAFNGKSWTHWRISGNRRPPKTRK